MRLPLRPAIAVLSSLAAMAWGSARLVDRAGQQIGAALASAAAELPRPSSPHGIDPQASADADPGAREEAWGGAPPARDLSGKRRTSGDRAPAVRGIRVRAPVVLRLAQRGVRPSGVPVQADGERPAGLALRGVSALGVGLQDGDILTHVGGAPARSVDAVVATILRAYRKVAPALSGRIWRRGEVLQVVVEIPYPAGSR